MSKAPLPVAVDAMGGDHGPKVVVEGVISAVNDIDCEAIIVGKESEIKSCLDSLGAGNNPKIKIKNANSVVTMDDSPAVVMRGKTDSSIRVAFQLVKNGEASSLISPGNTGAVMAAGLVLSGTLPGIARPAIATLIPKVGKSKPTVLLDSGANVDCHAHQLVQFALMGSCYARVALPVENPRTALLSNGSEPSKGTDIIRAAAQSMSEMEELNYIGYVEGRDIPKDSADVVVCDGFVGNLILKAMEGTVELVLDTMKMSVERSLSAKVGMFMAKPALKTLFSQKLDPASYGGAPLLGLNHMAIICHGSSNGRAIMNAIKVAKKFVDAELIKKMEQALISFDLKKRI